MALDIPVLWLTDLGVLAFGPAGHPAGPDGMAFNVRGLVFGLVDVLDNAAG